MGHIGEAIREERRKQGYSAAFMASKLERPITGQAFAQKEINGRFSWNLVVEVAKILEKDLDYFYK